jgi:hypothetical protein
VNSGQAQTLSLPVEVLKRSHAGYPAFLGFSDVSHRSFCSVTHEAPVPVKQSLKNTYEFSQALEEATHLITHVVNIEIRAGMVVETKLTCRRHP